MRFDLTAEDSISAHGIWDSIRKFSRFDLKLQDLGTKSLDNERIRRTCFSWTVSISFHKHNNDMASA